MNDHTDISAGQVLEAGERAYRTAGGVRAIVNVTAKPHEKPGCYAFTLGALAVDESGAAILDHHAKPIAAGPHMVTIQPDSDVDVAAHIEGERQMLLTRLDRAVANTRAIATLAGIRIHSDTLH